MDKRRDGLSRPLAADFGRRRENGVGRLDLSNGRLAEGGDELPARSQPASLRLLGSGDPSGATPGAPSGTGFSAWRMIMIRLGLMRVSLGQARAKSRRSLRDELDSE